jgi:iron complex transport system substrate-binding protein
MRTSIHIARVRFGHPASWAGMPFMFSIRTVGCLILALALAACSRAPARDAAVAYDDFGEPVRFDSVPQRIISLNPTTTEILFAIGAGTRVVGRSKWDSWPDSARFATPLGDAIRPNVEALLALRPDLVLLYASNDNRPAAERLQAAGVRTLAFKIDSIAQFRRMTRLLGHILGDSVRANAVVDSVDRTLDHVRRTVADLPRPTVFFHTWEPQIITIGGGSFLNELAEIAGGRNVYADLTSPSPMVTLEDVVRRDPGLIVVSPLTAASIRRNPAWQAVRAVREGRIVIYDTNVVGRPSVTLGMAAVNLGSLFHPEHVRK